MHITGESLLVILIVGLIAGWLAGKIVEGSGFGLIGDMAVGIVGALIGSWLMPRLGYTSGDRDIVGDHRRHDRRRVAVGDRETRHWRLSAASFLAILMSCAQLKCAV
jgi:uncharacterized membrane protein YeaQ/YmgE (transglycosylase-associated protein family)